MSATFATSGSRDFSATSATGHRVYHGLISEGDWDGAVHWLGRQFTFWWRELQLE